VYILLQELVFSQQPMYDPVATHKFPALQLTMFAAGARVN
jgi:hypothetical protein